MAERVLLPKGTIEHLIVDVSDRLKNLTSLDGTNPTFDIRAKYATSFLVEGSAATSIGMTAFCLVDTTTYDSGEYELFIKFSNLPEQPRLGPFEFEVNA